MDEGCLLVQKPPRGPSRAPTLISCGPLVPVSSRGLRQAALRFGPPPHGGQALPRSATGRLYGNAFLPGGLCQTTFIDVHFFFVL